MSVPRPPLDPELEVALQVHQDRVVVTLTAEQIPAMRLRAEAPEATIAPDDDRYVSSVHVAPGPPGAPDVRVVLVRPARADRAAPCIVHLHGGGLVAGSVHDDLIPVLELAEPHGAVVASVDYRLAPEDPYPAAVEDAYAALAWIAGNAARLGVDPDRLVVEGISAGGGLAAATALLARDRGGPSIAGQLLICPMLDDRNDSASSWQMAGHGVWDRTANETAWRAYLGPDAGSARVAARAAPAREGDLTGLPPTFLDVGSAETFRDEVVDFATRQWLAGGDVELHVWAGGFHGFDYLVPDAQVARAARAARQNWLTRLLHRKIDTGG